MWSRGLVLATISPKRSVVHHFDFTIYYTSNSRLTLLQSPILDNTARNQYSLP